MAVIIFRDFAGAHVDLERRQDELWHLKLRVAFGAKLNELPAGPVASDMDVCSFLFADRGLPRDGAPTRSVIVADEEPYTKRR